MAQIVNKSVPNILANPNSAMLEIAVGNDGTRATGVTTIDWETNTGSDFGIGFIQAYKYSKSTYNNNRQFIKLLESFKRQFPDYQDFFGANELSLQDKMKLSANLLLKLAPDKISLQLTDDGAIYYTAQINNITIYLSHYLNAELEQIDEFLASIFIDGQNVINGNGNIDDVMHVLNKSLARCNANSL